MQRDRRQQAEHRPAKLDGVDPEHIADRNEVARPVDGIALHPSKRLDVGDGARGVPHAPAIGVENVQGILQDSEHELLLARLLAARRALITNLEDECQRLKVAELETDTMADSFQRILDYHQQRMDDARRLAIWHEHLENYPETMGNIFRAPRKHEP